jgi:hypothetical protein
MKLRGTNLFRRFRRKCPIRVFNHKVHKGKKHKGHEGISFVAFVLSFVNFVVKSTRKITFSHQRTGGSLPTS